MHLYWTVSVLASLAIMGQCVPLKDVAEVEDVKKSNDNVQFIPPGNPRQSRAYSAQKAPSGVAPQGAPRQAALAALTPLLLPLAASILGPVASASGNGLVGLLGNFFRRNRTSVRYDAYMVNVPGGNGPHLYLRPHTKDDTPTNAPGGELPALVAPLSFGGQRPVQDSGLHTTGFIRPLKRRPSEYFDEEDEDVNEA